MTIRKAVVTDASRINYLLTQLGYPELDESAVKRKIESHEVPPYHLLVAEENGLVVAFASLHQLELMHQDGKSGRITSFCVEESFRSRGVGKELLTYIEKFLFDQGCKKIELTSNNRRSRAHEFYLRNGYTETSRHFVKNKH